MQKSQLKMDYLAVLIAAAILYGISVAPGVLWQDNGMAQIRVLNHDYVGKLGLALAHPLFYLVAQVFQVLPFQESAFKTSLVAAVASMFAVANLYLFLATILPPKPYSRFSALLAAISLALAHTFWQHASITETYNLTVFLVTCELLAAMKFIKTGRPQWWLLIFFLNGLECSNHMLATLTLAAVLIWSLTLLYRKTLKLRWLVPAFLVWVLGCLPYLYLGFQAWMHQTPLTSVIHSMLFGEYQKDVLNTRITLTVVIMSFGTIALNFPSPNIFLIPVGLAKAKKLIDPRLFTLLVLATLFHFLFAFRYSIRDQYTFFILTVVFLAIWLGIGAAWVMSKTPKIRYLLLAFALLPPFIYYSLPALAHKFYPDFGYHSPIPYRDEGKYFLWPWKTGYHGPDRLVRETFDLAKPYAIIIADDTAARPFFYYQLAKKQRPDVYIAASLFDHLPDPQKIQKLTELLKNRQILIVRPYPRYCPQWILDHFQLAPKGPIHQIQNPK